MKRVSKQELEILRHSGLFDEKWYLEQYPDVKVLGMDPLEHYLWVGRAIGRSATRPPSIPLSDTVATSADTASNPILFISGEPIDKPGYVYRIARYSEAYEKLGQRVICIQRQEILAYLSMVESAKLIVIWRAAWCAEIEKLLDVARASGVPTAFDVDDLMVRPDLANAEVIDAIRYDKKDPNAVKRHYKNVTQTMVNCTFGTATTHELAWQMRRNRGRRPTFVLPNGYGQDTYALSRVHARLKARNEDGLIRIGYASGSRTHQKDFEACADAVAQVLCRHENLRLVLFRQGDLATLDMTEFPMFKGLEHKIEWRPFVAHDKLPTEMARFDINLAPLEHGNPFCEAKSELKFFEAAIADVPTIASPTGPFKRSIVHGETGFLASSPDDWLKCIETLVSDPVYRRKMGREAHRRALWPFGPSRRVALAFSMMAHLDGGRYASRAFCYDEQEIVRDMPSVPMVDYRVVFESDNGRSSDVTVIIPLHNYETYIEEALESVRLQTLGGIDLIVVDDCSTDSSQEIVLRWMERNSSRFNRAVLVQHIVNQGLGASRNTAFDLADTLYVMALDADNKLRPECCEQCLAAIQAEGAAFSYPMIQQFGDNSHLMGDRRFNPADFIPGNGIDAMAMISKEAWSLVGGYATHRLGWQDYDFWCRIVNRGLHGVQVSTILADYRVHQSSMLRTSTDKSKNKGKLMDLMESEHGWLSLTAPERSGHRTPIVPVD